MTTAKKKVILRKSIPPTQETLDESPVPRKRVLLVTKRTPIDLDIGIPKSGQTVRYSCSLVTQGTHRFYTLTMPSEVLAACCFATNRLEDPQKGFQRVLDEKRAQEIADYMDAGMGTIPSSIVLSAQDGAELKLIGGGKTVEFKFSPHSFLILDGQHRVFGFSKSKTNLRVPVVIYNGLSREEESRLFIDINTKQRPVPNELLLDIKQLAEYESNEEKLLRELFDEFSQDQNSPLVGLMSAASRKNDRLSRVTFNAAVKPVLKIFSTRSVETIYPALRNYLDAFCTGLRELGQEKTITSPIVFRASLELFPEVAERVHARHGSRFREAQFSEELSPMFSRAKASWFSNPPRSHKELASDLSKSLKSAFSI